MKGAFGFLSSAREAIAVSPGGSPSWYGHAGEKSGLEA